MALCVVVLLAAIHPGHAAWPTAQVAPTPVYSFVVQSGDEAPMAADAVMDHSACQCGCKTTMLPTLQVQIASVATSAAIFGVTLSTASHSVAQAPPSEPPRT